MKRQLILPSALALGLLLALLAGLNTLSPVRAASNYLFVSTAGSGDCSQASPCALQTALSQATDGDAIYLAQGTYTGTGAAVITVTKSITLYGGWNGTTATPPVRDPDAYPTTLDGEGQRRVIYISGDITPTIDGFIVTRGNAGNVTAETGCGGGIYSVNATPIIANNLITGNVAYTGTVSPGNGGGLCIRTPQGTAVITANRVISNVASLNTSGAGGGIRILSAPNAQVVNNVVLSNTAVISGGPGYGGGIAIEGSSAGATLRGNRLEHNVANARGKGYGGGIDVASPSVLLTDNVVLSNTASITGGVGFGGGIAVMGGDGVTVTGNRIEHNVAQGGPAASFGSYGGGAYCLSSDNVTISDNVVRYNIASIPASGRGGGIGIQNCDRLTVVGNTLRDNVGSTSTTGDAGRGGGLWALASRDLAINANWVLSNTARYGGGLYLSHNTTFTMTNNIVADNHASYEGGGMAFETDGASKPVTGTLVHNTFAANDRGSGDGRIAIHLNDPYVTLVLTNNLIYSHTYGIYVVTTSTVHLDHTFFYAHSNGDTGGPGVIVNTNPIAGQDPLLTADYRLEDGSPAIDAGLTLPWLLTDVDGDTRPQGAGYDVGADEFAWRYIYLPLVLKNHQ